MSVLIKGMEMPTNCRVCPLKMNCDDCEGWECVCVPLQAQIGYLDDLLTDKRRDDCPLVPVPPHGRLIDADALDDVCVGLNADNWRITVGEHKLLDRVLFEFPTILEAEEGV